MSVNDNESEERKEERRIQDAHNGLWDMMSNEVAEIIYLELGRVMTKSEQNVFEGMAIDMTTILKSSLSMKVHEYCLALIQREVGK